MTNGAQATDRLKAVQRKKLIYLVTYSAQDAKKRVNDPLFEWIQVYQCIIGCKKKNYANDSAL